VLGNQSFERSVVDLKAPPAHLAYERSRLCGRQVGDGHHAARREILSGVCLGTAVVLAQGGQEPARPQHRSESASRRCQGIKKVTLSNSAEQAEVWVRECTHCSMAVKLTHDGSQLYIGHNTWGGQYHMMLRVHKRYEFGRGAPIAMSSYPPAEVSVELSPRPARTLASL